MATTKASRPDALTRASRLYTKAWKKRKNIEYKELRDKLAEHYENGTIDSEEAKELIAKYNLKNPDFHDVIAKVGIEKFKSNGSKLALTNLLKRLANQRF